MIAVPELRESPAGALPYPDGTSLELPGGGAAVTAWSAPDLGAGTVLLGRLSYDDPRLGSELLRLVRSRGEARRVLGPMDGSTWGAYRVAIPDGDSRCSPFHGEPSGGDLAVWTDAGFRPSVFYQSRWTSLPVRRHRSEVLAARISQAGLVVREAEPSPELLRRLFEFSNRAFARNPFFRPLSFEGFCALQGRVATRQPLLLTAESGAGALLGFGLAYADPAKGGRLILKTLAAAPEAYASGLGARLADEIHLRASERGCRTVVHALMHEDNASVRLSLRYESRLLRRYALLEWRPE